MVKCAKYTYIARKGTWFTIKFTNHTHPSIHFLILYPILPLYTVYPFLKLILIFTMLLFHSVITILSQFLLFLTLTSCVHIVSLPLVFYFFLYLDILSYILRTSLVYSTYLLSPLIKLSFNSFPPPGSARTSHLLLCFHSSLYISFFLFLYIIS